MGQNATYTMQFVKALAPAILVAAVSDRCISLSVPAPAFAVEELLP